MATFSKTRRSTLGTPPPIEEASQNLLAPETAPPSPEVFQESPKLRPRIDGRSLRKSHRTVQFATRVTPEFDEHIRFVALRDGLKLVEVLEKALEAYENSLAAR